MRPPVRIFDASLRDSIGDFVTLHLRAHELGEAVRLLDKVGFAAVDGFGGGTAERLARDLREDPWERLRAIRRGLSHTPLQAVIRSRMLFGQKPAPLSTIRATLRHLKDLGVDCVKISDPGIDLEGTRQVILVAKSIGFRVSAAVPVAWGKINDPRDALLEGAVTFSEAGADEVVLQDAFGLLSPAHVASLVRSFTQHCSLPLRLHIHDTNLLSVATLEAGISAGASAADATISSLGWTYSPPRTESLVMALRGSDRAPDIDLTALENASAWFELAKERKGFGHKALHGVDHGLLRGEMPSTVRRALIEELRKKERPDLIERAWKEVNAVWEDFGCPPLLSPLVEAVCAQTVVNVCSETPYSTLDQRAVAYLGGLYGQPRPGVKAGLVEKAVEYPIAPEMKLPELSEAPAGPMASVEEKLTSILFPESVAARELHGAAKAAPASDTPAVEASIPRKLMVERHGESFEVALEGIGPKRGNKRTLFLRIGGDTAAVEVTFPQSGAAPEFTLVHHGKQHKVKILEIRPKGKRTLPVVLREDEQVLEVLYSFPKSL